MSLFSVLQQFRWPRNMVYRVGEVLHLCAIYFGIAALMILWSMWLVPSTREQTEQIYTTVLQTLQPAGWSLHQGLIAGAKDPTAVRPTPEQIMGDERAAAARPSALTDEQQPTGPLHGGLGADPLTATEQASAADAAHAAGADEAIASGQAKQAGPTLSAYAEFAQSLEVAASPVHLAGVSSTQYEALQSYIARKYHVAYTAVGALIDIAYHEAAERELDPLLVLAVIAIESSYNPFAESGVGAQGLMQIMTKVHQEKFAPFAEGTLAVFSPDANIQIGAQILSDCLKRRGSIPGALACYVGATGPSDGGYGKRVLAERSRIALASGIAVQE